MPERRWLLLATVSLGLLLITLDNSILYTALPTLSQELGASASEGLWIINAYPLVMAGLLLGAGTLGDRIGHRRMFEIGLVIFALASVLAAFAPSPTVLVAGRALLAVGAASMMPATLALIRIGFTDTRERNLAIAVWGSISVLGMALGPIISGALLAVFWWGSVFLINVPVVVVALVATRVVAPANDPDHSRRWDLRSSVMAMAALAGLVLVIKEAAKPGRHESVLLIALVVAVLGALAFTRRQRRLEHPLLDFSIFRNRAFSAGVLGAAATMFAVAGLQLITTQRFQLVSGFSPLQAGLLIAAVALGSLPTSLAAGALLHVVGLRILISGGIAVAAVGVLAVALALGHALVFLILGLVLVGAGIGSVMAVASTAIVGNVPPGRAGMASSLEEVSYEFGSLIAVALLGTMSTSLYAAFVDLPAGAPGAASQSLTDAVNVAAGENGILEAAFAAFDDSYRIIALVIAALLVLASAATAWSLRAYGPRTASTLPDAVH